MDLCCNSLTDEIRIEYNAVSYTHLLPLFRNGLRRFSGLGLRLFLSAEAPLLLLFVVALILGLDDHLLPQVLVERIRRKAADHLAVAGHGDRTGLLGHQMCIRDRS